MRALSDAVKTQLASRSCKIGFLAELAFVGKTLRFSTRNYDFSWGGYTWVGNGFLLPFTSIRENNDLSAEGIEATFMNAGSQLISAVLTLIDKAATSRFYIAFWDANDQIIADPYNFFSGYMDVPTIYDSPSATHLSITFESDLLRLTTTREWRYSQETQKIRFPTINDQGFASVEAVANWDGFWGKKKKPKKEKDRDKKKKGRK